MKMDVNKYFEKYGCIYGVSEKYEFGSWNGYAVKFADLDAAFEWLNTEEHDFRQRKLVAKAEAKKYFHGKAGTCINGYVVFD